MVKLLVGLLVELLVELLVGLLVEIQSFRLLQRARIRKFEVVEFKLFLQLLAEAFCFKTFRSSENTGRKSVPPL